ncbi:MAG: Ig-like domain-containing protein [Acidobacteriota bacterium]
MVKRKNLSLLVIIITCLSLLAPVFVMPQAAGAASTYTAINVPSIDVSVEQNNCQLGRVLVEIAPGSLINGDAMTIIVPGQVTLGPICDSIGIANPGIGPYYPVTTEPTDLSAGIYLYAPITYDGVANAIYDNTLEGNARELRASLLVAQKSSPQTIEVMWNPNFTGVYPMDRKGYLYIYFLASKVASGLNGDIRATFIAPANSGFSSGSLVIAKTSAPVTNLDPWNLVNSYDPNRFFYGASFVNGKFIICGYQDDVWSSDDGLSWTKMATGCYLPTRVIGVPEKPLVLICGDGSVLASTDAGASWSLQYKSTDWLNGIAYGNNRFVTVGYAGEVLISVDGLNWNSSRFSGDTYLHDVAYGDGKFVAVGGNRAIEVSTDGFNWQKVDSGVSETIDGFAVDFNGVTYANGQFVAVGFRGTTLYSRDGYTWTQSPRIVSNTLFDITYGDNKFVAVGDSGSIIASNNGQVWNEKHTPIVAGSLKGVAYGNGRFVSAGDWNALLCSTTEPINVPVTSVTLNQTSLSLNTGSTATLTATVAPSNATNKNVSWSSSNTGVATVDNGIVTAVAAGTSTITVQTEDGGFTADCSVTVTSPNVPVTGLTLNKNGLMLTAGGQPVALQANVAPANATNKNVTWKSSNPKVATVDSNGVVKPIKQGFALITATTQDAGFKAYCFVTVIKPRHHR